MSEHNNPESVINTDVSSPDDVSIWVNLNGHYGLNGDLVDIDNDPIVQSLGSVLLGMASEDINEAKAIDNRFAQIMTRGYFPEDEKDLVESHFDDIVMTEFTDYCADDGVNQSMIDESLKIINKQRLEVASDSQAKEIDRVFDEIMQGEFSVEQDQDIDPEESLMHTGERQGVSERWHNILLDDDELDVPVDNEETVTNEVFVPTVHKTNKPFPLDKSENSVDIPCKPKKLIFADSEHDIVSLMDPDKPIGTQLKRLVEAGIVVVIELDEQQLADEGRLLAAQRVEAAVEAAVVGSNLHEEQAGDRYDVFYYDEEIEHIAGMQDPEDKRIGPWGVPAHGRIDNSVQSPSLWVLQQIEDSRRKKAGLPIDEVSRKALVEQRLTEPTGVVVNVQDSLGRAVSPVQPEMAEPGVNKNTAQDREWVEKQVVQIFRNKGWARDGNLKHLTQTAEIINTDGTGYSLASLLKAESPDEIVKKYMDDLPKPERLRDLVAVLLSKAPGSPNYRYAADQTVSDPGLLYPAGIEFDDSLKGRTNASINVRALEGLIKKTMKAFPRKAVYAEDNEFLKEAMAKGEVNYGDIVQTNREAVIDVDGMEMRLVSSEMFQDTLAKMQPPKSDSLAHQQLDTMNGRRDPINTALQIQIIDRVGDIEVAYLRIESSVSGKITIRSDKDSVDSIGTLVDTGRRLKDSVDPEKVEGIIQGILESASALEVESAEVDKASEQAERDREAIETDRRRQQQLNQVASDAASHTQRDEEASKDAINGEFPPLAGSGVPLDVDKELISGYAAALVPPIPPDSMLTENYNKVGEQSIHAEPDTEKPKRIGSRIKSVLNRLKPKFLSRKSR